MALILVRWQGRAAALAALLALAPAAGCRQDRPPAAGESARTIGTWDAWRDLSPLVEIAETHAPEPTVAAMHEARALLRERKARSAYARLDALAASEGRHWIAAARGDLAALYFTLCIRGAAWRLDDAGEDTPTTRRADYSEDTAIERGDISVEALLVDLDAAVAAKIPALATHARIARARVAAYVNRCPANDQVAEMSEASLKRDLATLAAEGSLTPDLAFMWAQIQFAEYSGAAARPFLLQAREAGYDDPSLAYLLAAIALEQLELDRADEYADEAMAAYVALGDTMQQAQIQFVKGEIARARERPKKAAAHYKKAQELMPAHIAAILGEARLALAEGESTAIAAVGEKLAILAPAGEVAASSRNLESLVVMVEDPALTAVCRAALLDAVEQDADATRRGLRYYYAATLDARLGEYEHARGHAILARDEFEEAGAAEALIAEVSSFLERLSPG